MMTMWVYLLTGVTGAWTASFLLRLVKGLFQTPSTLKSFHSPKGGCTEAVVAELKKARKEILVMAYSFTSKPIAQELVSAKARGVHVDILLDKSNEHEEHTVLPQLLSEGMTPLIDHAHAIAHNKIMIIDRKVLITGSFNFTNQAEHDNAENLLIIHGHPGLVRSYYETFTLHRAHSVPPVAHATRDAGGAHGAVRAAA